MNSHIYSVLVRERMRDAEEAAERARRIREARRTTKRREPVPVEPLPRHEEIEAEEPVLAGHR
ncbi:MAG TPA: hypothetical protein VHI14_07830 [Jatrophihabitantaceae bacterium]|nr:hypothetical protein [Jatrophihabitantaceae bacterium]